MKIVIDISEEDYKRIQDIPDVFNSLTSRMYSAIRNGTPLPDGAEILTIDKRTLKAVTGRFVIYDREWLKEHFNTTEAHLYGGTRASDVPDTNAGDLISRQAVLEQINCWIGSGEYRYTNATCYLTKRMQDISPATPQPCDDCISRQDVLDLAERGKLVSNGNYKSVCDAINGLPSVEPERKTGKWIDYPFENVFGLKLRDYRCNLCAYFVNAKTKFCPNCGAKMEVEN